MSNEVRITIPVTIDEHFLRFMRDHVVGDEGLAFLQAMLDENELRGVEGPAQIVLTLPNAMKLKRWPMRSTPAPSWFSGLDLANKLAAIQQEEEGAQDG